MIKDLYIYCLRQTLEPIPSGYLGVLKNQSTPAASHAEGSNYKLILQPNFNTKCVSLSLPFLSVASLQRLEKDYASRKNNIMTDTSFYKVPKCLSSFTVKGRQVFSGCERKIRYDWYSCPICSIFPDEKQYVFFCLVAILIHHSMKNAKQNIWNKEKNTEQLELRKKDRSLLRMCD